MGCVAQRPEGPGGTQAAPRTATPLCRRVRRPHALLPIAGACLLSRDGMRWAGLTELDRAGRHGRTALRRPATRARSVEREVVFIVWNVIRAWGLRNSLTVIVTARVRGQIEKREGARRPPPPPALQPNAPGRPATA